MAIDSEIIATEISNEEDFKKAVLAADSGRLVIATIEAKSVWELMSAYLKLGLPLRLKLDNLKLILNQRIAPLPKRIKRREIGVFETLEITPAIQSFILEAEKDEVKEKFWEKLAALALKEGYKPLQKEL